MNSAYASQLLPFDINVIIFLLLQKNQQHSSQANANNINNHAEGFKLYANSSIQSIISDGTNADLARFAKIPDPKTHPYQNLGPF
uniref:Uncharacterized protein n=1 Tax=Rhizophora mucronata TaxID=61149 RepID=A0A2P2JM31_RHIMU